MVIGISINEVLRDFIGQLTYTYNKYIKELDLKEGEVTNFNLVEFFKFDSVDDLNRFMYLEAPLEIFGHADQAVDGIINQFNHFLTDIKDDEEHQIQLVSKEANKSIPSTFFFLSKTGCRIDNIRFVTDAKKEWDGVDILITANPDALKAKPEGKTSVKVTASYNADSPADFTINTLLDFIKDESLRNQIFNTKITTYEEI